LSFGNNNLTTLDVSSNTALTNLSFGNNNLTTLDVSQNTDLASLLCEDNMLTTLNVSMNNDLIYLSCFSNQLTTLDVSKNKDLTYLYCFNNQLTNLDLSSNTALTTLWCDFNQLTSLNVANGNNKNMTAMIASNNTNLSCIEVDNAAWSTTNWTDIDTQTFFSEDCPQQPQTYVPDDNFELSLISQGYDVVLDDSVTTANINTLSSLNLSSSSISDLTGIEAFSALTYLDCEDNKLTTLDLSQNTALNYLDIDANALTSLEVSLNTALTFLECADNQLITIDLSQNIALTVALCENNQLTSLDLRNGNNTLVVDFSTTGNPDLTCITVDDAA
jgi:Leucine-rich repeat (LRR) protein